MSITTTPTRQAADQFLKGHRIAVTGVSHAPKGHGSNAVYTFLRKQGYEVFAVNPNAPEVEGDRAYPSLGEIPGGVDAVVIGTCPERALDTMHECADLASARSGCTARSGRAVSRPTPRRTVATTTSP
ncbi:MAG: CoA-binding protein [Nocardioides sp.]